MVKETIQRHSLDIVIIGGALAISILFFSLAYADSSTTSVTVVNAAPSVTAVAITPSTITLTENATTSITVTATITDGNGCEDVFSSGTKQFTLYRSGVGASCSQDNNNCYVSSTFTVVEVGNTCSGGVDTSGDIVGTTSIWYFAEATDASSSFPSENWEASVKATDFSSASSTATSSAELNSLYALNVTGAISYGSVAAGADTGSTNQTATTTNTGNFKIDLEISGTDMTGGGTIVASQQKYGSSSVTYASLSYNLSTSATARDWDIGKATASSTPAASSTFWGIAIPTGQTAASYSGTNTFTAIFSSD